MQPSLAQIRSRALPTAAPAHSTLVYQKRPRKRALDIPTPGQAGPDRDGQISARSEVRRPHGAGAPLTTQQGRRSQQVRSRRLAEHHRI